MDGADVSRQQRKDNKKLLIAERSAAEANALLLEQGMSLRNAGDHLVASLQCVDRFLRGWKAIFHSKSDHVPQGWYWERIIDVTGLDREPMEPSEVAVIDPIALQIGAERTLHGPD